MFKGVFMKAKKVLFIVLPLVLIVCFLGACASIAGLFAVKEFNGFTYKIVGNDPNKTVTITGYNGAGGAVEIPAEIEGFSVTAIEKNAFDKSFRLTSLTIPASVIIIADSVDEAENAFDGTTGLANITVDEANSVYSSAEGVLFNKEKTKLLMCPEGKIGNYTIPSSVTDIVYCAFEDCSKLINVTIPGSVNTIGGGVKDDDILLGAFMKCTGLKTITISDGVTAIGKGAFAACENLTSITIPDSVTYIGGNAFAGCARLTSVTITPVNGRIWDVEVAGSRNSSGDYEVIWVFANCPLNNASKTALLNAGYPSEKGKF